MQQRVKRVQSTLGQSELLFRHYHILQTLSVYSEYARVAHSLDACRINLYTPRNSSLSHTETPRRRSKSPNGVRKSLLMGRGSGWDSTELQHLVQAWIFSNEDPITGIDQTVPRFNKTIFEKFKNLAPHDASEKNYGGRTPKSVKISLTKSQLTFKNSTIHCVELLFQIYLVSTWTTWFQWISLFI